AGGELAEQRGGRDRLERRHHFVERLVELLDQGRRAELAQRRLCVVDALLYRREHLGHVDLGDEIAERLVDAGRDVDLAHFTSQGADRRLQGIRYVAAAQRAVDVLAHLVQQRDRLLRGLIEVDVRDLAGQGVDLTFQVVDQGRQVGDGGIRRIQQRPQLVL